MASIRRNHDNKNTALLECNTMYVTLLWPKLVAAGKVRSANW
jgi:hypothetical protein